MLILLMRGLSVFISIVLSICQRRRRPDGQSKLPSISDEAWQKVRSSIKDLLSEGNAIFRCSATYSDPRHQYQHELLFRLKTSVSIRLGSKCSNKTLKEIVLYALEKIACAVGVRLASSYYKIMRKISPYTLTFCDQLFFDVCDNPRINC